MELFTSRRIKYTWYEWILLTAIVFVIGIQVIRGVTCDITYMSYDDASYTVFAADAMNSDWAGMIDPFTGDAGVMDIKDSIPTFLYFPAFLSFLSDLPVTSVQHTILYIQLIFLAYSVYFYMAKTLFNERVYQLIFVLIIAVLYIYGYHSHYSLTFRLLGPNYQGKAVLAVSLTPFVFTFLINVLNQPYHWKIGVLFFALSLGAVSLTLWATGTMLVVIGSIVLLSLTRRNKNWRHLFYILWSSLAIVGYVVIYLVNRYAI